VRHRFEVRAENQFGLNEIVLNILREFSSKEPMTHVLVAEWELTFGDRDRSKILRDARSKHEVVFTTARILAKEMQELNLLFFWLTLSFCLDPIRLHREDFERLPWADGNTALWEQPFAPQLPGACLEVIIFDASYVVITLAEDAPDWVVDACMNAMIKSEAEA
jgi:hypothetical protein